MKARVKHARVAMELRFNKRSKLSSIILMHLLMKHNIGEDNTRNLRQYILQYTVGNSLMSFIASGFFHLATLQFEQNKDFMVNKRKSALEWAGIFLPF